MKQKILSKKQIAEKFGLWKREEIDWEYQKQFREKVKIFDIITKQKLWINQ